MISTEDQKNQSPDQRAFEDLGLVVADHVSAMLAYWDKNLICRFANNAYQSWFGKTKEEMVGKITMQELLGPLFEKNLPYILEVLKGKQQEFERAIPVPSGEIRYSIANYYPDISNGEVRGFFVHVADISNLKKLESQLKASENKFRGLLENAPDAIVIVDNKGIIQLINIQCEKLFGYSKTELLGKPVERLIPHSFKADHILKRENYYQHPIARPMGEGLELLGLRKDGKEFPVEISLSPLFAEEGILVSAAIRDISWKVQKEKELKESLEIITRQKNQLMNFAYVVSHNLKSYANNLDSILNLFCNTDSDQEKQEMLLFLKNISSSFSATVEHLNEISEVQMQGDLELKEIYLKNYIDKCIQSLSIQIKNTAAEIQNKVSADIKFIYNEAYIESIILNFLTNAIKYRHPNRIPVVEIETFKKDDFIVLKIKDNGLGINLEKYGKKLFGMYKTFHGNPDAKGIGLFISKYQVETMGGHIEVQSKEGVGTEFNIYFKIK